MTKLVIILFVALFIYSYIPIQIGTKTFYLHTSNISTVIDTLQQNGYGVSIIDKLMLRYASVPKIGWYTLEKKSYRRFDFLDQLNQQKSKTLTIKIFAGENSVELSKRLANDLKLDSKKLLQHYHKKSQFQEADILAGRYIIAREAKEEAVINTLMHMSNLQMKTYLTQHFPTLPTYKEHNKLLTIASIIQKETNDIKEMSLVSSVIYNRLKKDMKLQMDGTLNYGKHSRKIITSSRIKEDTSAYNTYKYKGIPPTPICTVSIDAFDAAVNPKKTNYLYFMLNKEGKHTFESSYKAHLRNIKLFKTHTIPDTPNMSIEEIDDNSTKPTDTNLTKKNN